MTMKKRTVKCQLVSLQQMKQWQAAGERLVLCLDANKNIYRAELGRQLMDLHGLGMREVVGNFTGK